MEDGKQKICDLQGCDLDFMFWNRICLSMESGIYKSIFTEPDPEWDDMADSGEYQKRTQEDSAADSVMHRNPGNDDKLQLLFDIWEKYAGL